MTRFTVVWSQPTQNRLAGIWVGAADRNAVTAAANAIDVELASDPASKGTTVHEGLRALHIPPLHVMFSVDEADRLVRVVSVQADEQASESPQRNGQTPSAN
jgi:plasmid stabilization system protein ParE